MEPKYAPPRFVRRELVWAACWGGKKAAFGYLDFFSFQFQRCASHKRIDYQVKRRPASGLIVSALMGCQSRSRNSAPGEQIHRQILRGRDYGFSIARVDVPGREKRACHIALGARRRPELQLFVGLFIPYIFRRHTTQAKIISANFQASKNGRCKRCHLFILPKNHHAGNIRIS